MAALSHEKAHVCVDFVTTQRNDEDGDRAEAVSQAERRARPLAELAEQRVELAQIPTQGADVAKRRRDVDERTAWIGVELTHPRRGQRGADARKRALLGAASASVTRRSASSASRRRLFRAASSASHVTP